MYQAGELCVLGVGDAIHSMYVDCSILFHTLKYVPVGAIDPTVSIPTSLNIIAIFFSLSHDHCESLKHEHF